MKNVIMRKEFEKIERELGLERSFSTVPSRTETQRFFTMFLGTLFPKLLGTGEPATRVRIELELKLLLYPILGEEESSRVCEGFFMEVPEIFRNLLDDARIYAENDPAAYSWEEVVLSYPGFYAVMIYRFSHLLHKLGVPVLPRMVSEMAHSKTGIDINPEAQIGSHFYIDHGTGIVIGQTTIIGDNVKIYQGVTLGAAFVDKGQRGKRRHPRIEDNVIIYAGSTILGGDTVIGHDSVIGGNVWLVKSVPPFSKVYCKPDIHIKEM